MLSYKKFLDKNKIYESLVTSINELIKVIDGEKVNIFDTFNLNADDFDTDFDIYFLYNFKDFNKKLDKNELKKSEIKSTKDSETFIDKVYDIRFFLIHGINQSELEKPHFLILQYKDNKSDNWEKVNCYKVNDDMRNFYNKISTKTIELKKDGKNYIYTTSNSGNDWYLQNINDSNKKFKKSLSSEEFKKLLNNDKIYTNII